MLRFVEKGRLDTRKLPLDGFCHRKLRIVERISHTAHDAIVDSEHFIGKRFLGRIKKGHELIADTVSYGNAKGIEIAAGTASPFITSRPMTTVKAAFFSLSTTIQMIATSEIRISVSKYWILSIINQALSKTKEFPEIESRYFASEEEFRSLLASRQFIKAVILTDVCRYRFYAIPKLCIIAEFFTLHIPLALCPV